MFDIGFAELLIIGVVALLVVGPEKLPGTIRTASVYINRIRRGFNEIKREVQQELHNDSVMRDLRETGQELRNESEAFRSHVNETVGELSADIAPDQKEDSDKTPKPASPVQPEGSAPESKTAAETHSEPPDKEAS